MTARVTWRPLRRGLPPRFPFEPAERLSGLSTDRLRTRLGISGTTLRRYQQNGLDVYQADRLAVAIGYHPATIWPDWYEDDVDQLQGAA